MEIIPAIMPKTLNDLREAVGSIKGLVDTYQLDVMDGKFVSNRSWPYHTSGEYSDDFIGMIDHEVEGMPFWDEIDFEVDLMIDHVSFDDIEKWVRAGAKRIIIHAGSLPNVEATHELLHTIRKNYPKNNSADLSLLEIGIALHSDTPISYIKDMVEDLDCVQCMGINKIGFQGQAFNSAVLDTIKSLKATYPMLSVSVDGGVNTHNAAALKDAGVDRLVVGSALWESGDIEGTLVDLENA